MTSPVETYVVAAAVELSADALVGYMQSLIDARTFGLLPLNLEGKRRVQISASWYVKEI
jgi:hypothetical protein